MTLPHRSDTLQQHSVQLPGSGLLQPWEYMAVQVEGGANRAVPQSLADYLGMNVTCQRESGMSMPQIVEPDVQSSLSDYSTKTVGQDATINRTAVCE